MFQCRYFPKFFTPYYDEVWDYGPGAFTWTGKWGVPNAMWVLVPGPNPAGALPIRIRVKQGGTSGGKDENGAWWSWNGNMQRPTLRPSINYAGVWHGFISDGVMESA